MRILYRTKDNGAIRCVEAEMVGITDREMRFYNSVNCMFYSYNAKDRAEAKRLIKKIAVEGFMDFVGLED